jgi:uncharacterized membrane protein
MVSRMLDNQLSQKKKIGGSLERSLTSGYRLDVSAILQESWQQTRSHGFGLLLAIIAVMAIWILLSNSLLGPYLSNNQDDGGVDMVLVLSLLVAVVMSPLTAALDMLGLQQAVCVRAKPSQVFDFFRHGLRLGILTLLGSMITSLFGPLLGLLGLPIMLALIPSALISMGLVFTVPLVLERGLSPTQAIMISFKLFARGWLNIALLHGVLLVLFFVALIPMGLGLIWVAPFYFNCKGILYRELCGVAIEISDVSPPTTNHFSA